MRDDAPLYHTSEDECSSGGDDDIDQHADVDKGGCALGIGRELLGSRLEEDLLTVFDKQHAAADEQTEAKKAVDKEDADADRVGFNGGVSASRTDMMSLTRRTSAEMMPPKKLKIACMSAVIATLPVRR